MLFYLNCIKKNVLGWVLKKLFRDKISIFISCNVIFPLYLYFFQHPFWIAPFPFILLTLIELVFIFMMLASIIVYHTKSKFTWRKFRINFTWCFNLLQQKKQVPRLHLLISNVSFIPVQWSRQDVGNLSRRIVTCFIQFLLQLFLKIIILLEVLRKTCLQANIFIFFYIFISFLVFFLFELLLVFLIILSHFYNFLLSELF